MCFSVFSYSSSFPIKMHATDAKTQKIEPDPNFFWRTKVSEAVCKRDWHNVRSYFFFYVRKFWTLCAETFTLSCSQLPHNVATWCNNFNFNWCTVTVLNMFHPIRFQRQNHLFYKVNNFAALCCCVALWLVAPYSYLSFTDAIFCACRV